MRAHQNTILAMKISTLLMSVSAVVLVIMLLTSNAVAKQNSVAMKSQEVISAVAPVEAASLGDTAPPPATPRTRLVIMRVIAVTATPDVTAATNAMRLAMQGKSAIPIGGQPVEGEVQHANANTAATWTGVNEMPVLSDLNAISLPAAPAPVAAAAPARGGQSAAPKPAPAQPPVTTKTS